MSPRLADQNKSAKTGASPDYSSLVVFPKGATLVLRVIYRPCDAEVATVLFNRHKESSR